MSKKYNIAVVGATGAVGQMMIQILLERKFPIKNLDLLATNDTVVIYNDVNLKHSTGSLIADKIDYDFNTKFFKVSMFDEEKVKMKVIQ